MTVAPAPKEKERQRNTLVLKAKLFRGLSDPSRLSILEALSSGERTVSELVSVTGLSQPNVSGHLACLRECGIVANRQEGRYAYYSLSDPRMEDVLRTVEGILSGIAERIYDCTRYGDGGG